MGDGCLPAGMKRFPPSTCLARAPSFPIVCSHFFSGGGGGASSGHETVSTNYVPSKGPFFLNSFLTFFVLQMMTISVVDMVADE